MRSRSKMYSLAAVSRDGNQQTLMCIVYTKIQVNIRIMLLIETALWVARPEVHGCETLRISVRDVARGTVLTVTRYQAKLLSDAAWNSHERRAIFCVIGGVSATLHAAK